jgi:selenoprotein W-related protein
MEPMSSKAAVSIDYCTVCNFGGRAAWLGQELLAAYPDEIERLILVPRRDGVFIVRFDGREVFSYKEAGRFPEPRELKDALRAHLGLPPKPKHSSRAEQN